MAAGAGRKSPLTLAYQASRRGQVEEIITPEKWASCVKAMVRETVKGNVRAFEALVPWVMGAEPKEITVQVDVEERIRILAAAIGLEPADALREAQSILALTGETG